MMFNTNTNTNNNNNNNNDSFLIYACFGRSFDNFHNKNNKIHLISSIVGKYGNVNNIIANINTLNLNKSNEMKYLFVVSESDNKNIINLINRKLNDTELTEYKIYNKNKFKICRNLTLFIITIDELIGHLSFSTENNNLFENIFGSKTLKVKDIETIYQNSFFIFYKIYWSNIILRFKLNDIHISGGSISKRHLLNTVEIQLNSFLNEIFSYKLPVTEFYSFTKSNILCNTISTVIYKDYLEIKGEIPKIDMNKYIKYLEDNNLQENILENNTFLPLLTRNLFYSFHYLKDGIIRKLVSKIDKIKELISKFESECSSLTYEIDKVEGFNNNQRQSGMSSKEKKKYKEEQSYILNNPNLSLSKLNRDLNRKLSEIEDLKKDLTLLETKLEKFKSNVENLNIEDLNKIYEKISEGENKTKKHSKFKQTDNLNRNIRSYSTISYNRSKELTTSKELVDSNYELTKLVENNNSDKETNSTLFVNYFNDIIIDSNLNPFEKQQKIENKWIEHIIEKLDTIDNKTRNSLSYIIKKANETLNLTLESKKLNKKFPLFSQKLNKNHLIIAYSIMTNFYNKLGFTSIAMKIANDILYDIYSIEWKDYNKNESYTTFNNYIKSKNIDNVLKLRLGSFFIEIFCRKPTYIFERSYKPDFLVSNNNVTDNDLAVLEINDEFFNLVQNNFMLLPSSLPMLVEPKIWSETETGGYLESLYSRNEIITGSTNHKHTMDNKQSLYDAINKLNSIKFKINTDLLKFLDNEGSYVLEHYFKYKLKDKTDKNQSNVSLMIAKSLSKFNQPFYICTFADWRGRIYTNSFYLSYQGGDLSNALVNFYDGMPLNDIGKDYLYIYGANSYNVNNLSKKSFKDRIYWVKENYLRIINLDKNLILKASNLFLFTSFCLVMREIHYNPQYKVHLPIFLDATCSGIQHLAALIRDLETGIKVNLIPQNKSDQVGDIYSDLIDPINTAIKLYGENHLEYSEFKKIKLNRKHLKLPIMTKVYNVSVIGIADQLRNSFDKTLILNKLTYFSVPTEDGFTKLTNREIFILAEIINKQIFKSLPSLEAVYIYFKDIVKLCLQCNIPLTWFTPSGLKITQFYARSYQNKVSISFKNKSKSVILRETTDKLDNNKQINSIIPNIIHSLDASHLMNIINKGLQDVNCPDILTIHDCFGSHPNNIHLLKSLVISEFVKLYSNENFLKKLHERILQSLTDNQLEIIKSNDDKLFVNLIGKVLPIPELPLPGKLDYTDILFSEYLIT